ncbi:putative serine threonine protein kinase-like 3, partial [Homarus americanus]
MAGSATPLTATKVTRFRDAEMESMERMLSTKLISSFEMAMDIALEMDPNVDRSCTIIRNVKKDIQAYYEPNHQAPVHQPPHVHPNRTQLLGSCSRPQPSTNEPQPSTSEPQPSTSEPQPSTSEPQPSTSEPQPSTSEPQPSTSEPQPSTSGEQQFSVQIDSENESEVAADPGSEESEVAEDPGSEESEVAEDPSLLSPQ